MREEGVPKFSYAQMSFLLVVDKKRGKNAINSGHYILPLTQWDQQILQKLNEYYLPAINFESVVKYCIISEDSLLVCLGTF